MGTWSPTRAIDFAPRLDPAEIEARCAQESFTWGPQTLWLLCGLIWLFYPLVRDIPELARNTLLIALGATLLGALGVRHAIRRRNRRTVLYPLGGRIGCYQGNVFQYSFAPEEMVRVRMDFFGWAMTVFKKLIPMVLLIVIMGVVMWDGLKGGGLHSWQDTAMFAYAILVAIFGFVAIFRSHITLAFFWIPNGQGKADKPVYFHPRELRKLEAGNESAMR